MVCSGWYPDKFWIPTAPRGGFGEANGVCEVPIDVAYEAEQTVTTLEEPLFF